MEDCWSLLLLCTGVALVVGFLVGKWSEAWSWRETAADFRKKESGGAVYDVRMVA